MSVPLQQKRRKLQHSVPQIHQNNETIEPSTTIHDSASENELPNEVYRPATTLSSHPADSSIPGATTHSTVSSTPSTNGNSSTSNFDLFASNSSLGSFPISSLDSLQSLPTIPSLSMDTSANSPKSPANGTENTPTTLPPSTQRANGTTNGHSNGNGSVLSGVLPPERSSFSSMDFSGSTPMTSTESGAPMTSGHSVDGTAASSNTQLSGDSEKAVSTLVSNSTESTPPSPGHSNGNGNGNESQSGQQMAINPLTIPNGQNFVDITEYLNMPQSEAAKKLNIPASTLSKRWKEAVRMRKWPWRVVCKLDKEIMTLLHNVPQGAAIPKEIEGRLGYLMRKRQEELKPVVIRL